MSKPSSIGGRPKHVAEFVEGKEAATNFMGAMRTILSDSKTTDPRPVISPKIKKSK